MKLNRRNLDEDKYDQICKSLDYILGMAPNRHIPGIDVLHFIRPQPAICKKYESLYERGFNAAAKMFRLLAHNFLILLWDITRSIAEGAIGIGVKVDCHKDPDMIFVSHMVNTRHSSSAFDFYYGEMPIYYARSGKKVSLLYVNATGRPAKEIELKELHPNLKRALIPRPDENLVLNCRVLRRCISAAIGIGGLMKREGLEGAIALSLIDTISRATRLSFGIAETVKSVLSDKTRVVVTTYEGFSWERLVQEEVRYSGKGTRSFAYAHAGLFPKQHASLRAFNKINRPDMILTTSDWYSKIFSRIKGLSREGVMNIGSVRAKAEASSPFPRGNSILVLPEGIYESTLELFGFAIAAAVLNSERRFIFRVHPLVSMRRVLRELLDGYKLPENVYISTCSLEEDIKNSQYSLYQSSTAAVTAAENGVIPIYASLTSICQDPLRDTDTVRYEIEYPFELESVLEKSDGKDGQVMKTAMFDPLKVSFFYDNGFI